MIRFWRMASVRRRGVRTLPVLSILETETSPLYSSYQRWRTRTPRARTDQPNRNLPFQRYILQIRCPWKISEWSPRAAACVSIAQRRRPLIWTRPSSIPSERTTKSSRRRWLRCRGRWWLVRRSGSSWRSRRGIWRSFKKLRRSARAFRIQMLNCLSKCIITSCRFCSMNRMRWLKHLSWWICRRASRLFVSSCRLCGRRTTCCACSVSRKRLWKLIKCSILASRADNFSCMFQSWIKAYPTRST